MILSVAFLATLAVTTNNHIDHRMLSWSPIYSTRLSGNSREQQKPSPEDRRGGIVFDASRQIVMPAAELIASNGNLKVSTVGGSDKDDKGKTRFTPEQIDGLVKLHNTLRSNIQPSAADMNFMVSVCV